MKSAGCNQSTSSNRSNNRSFKGFDPPIRGRPLIGGHSEVYRLGAGQAFVDLPVAVLVGFCQADSKTVTACVVQKIKDLLVVNLDGDDRRTPRTARVTRQSPIERLVRL